MPGSYDANGIYLHDETDTFITTAAVLNLGQRSVSDALVPLVSLIPRATAAGDRATAAATAAADLAAVAASRAENAAADAAASAAALDSAGGIIYEDPTDPGLYLVAAGASITEDPADPGLYLIGA